ncbi:hypothetical protein FOZ63_008538 [Perkinsus olseni]|uniref:Uncharacterized protein n=1 Tax=Perkinsus olseni TaxID=32597 RepID=A0A7J6RM44_PEROL|nr:hypothetical protein FOZ60_005896 [Perkinsus olseni]KAF4702547.1 hypothetical protein FOZ62_000774 [Perkinsus olseni]KAF4721226.1 hypothetical protein FOZ63_008538 [Perkinsus olseni]
MPTSPIVGHDSWPGEPPAATLLADTLRVYDSKREMRSFMAIATLDVKGAFDNCKCMPSAASQLIESYLKGRTATLSVGGERARRDLPSPTWWAAQLLESLGRNQ